MSKRAKLFECTSLGVNTLSTLFSNAHEDFAKIRALSVADAVRHVAKLHIYIAFNETTEEERKIRYAFLSVLYARGYGVVKDTEKVAHYATVENSFVWLMQLGEEIDAFKSDSWKVEQKLCRVAGHVNYMLGVWHQHGIPNVLEPNKELTVNFLTKSVEFACDPDSLLNLGWCYSVGFGTEQDDVKAFSYYLESANQGLAQAQFNVGLCYHAGKGVPMSHETAAVWFKQAAVQKLAKAEYNYAVYKINGIGGVSKDKTLAIALFENTARKGHVDAMRTMGYICDKNKKTDIARTWYSRAADAGDKHAKQWLDKCFKTVSHFTTCGFE